MFVIIFFQTCVLNPELSSCTCLNFILIFGVDKDKKSKEHAKKACEEQKNSIYKEKKKIRTEDSKG